MAKQISPSEKKFSRPVTLTYIMGAHIWSVTTFAGNVKIILIRPVLWATNASLLRPHFSEIGLTSAGNSIKLKLSGTGSLPLFRTNLWPFSNKVLENSPRLLTTSRVKSKMICNTSRKKYKIGLFTYNISNLSWWNSTFGVLPLKTCYINTSTKVTDHLFDYGSTKKAET